MILVKGGYTPDTIIVRHGKPVRLNFRREETASCSDKVIFADFDKSADLPTGQTVPVEFLPERAGRIRLRLPDGHVQGQARGRVRSRLWVGEVPGEKSWRPVLLSRSSPRSQLEACTTEAFARWAAFPGGWGSPGSDITAERGGSAAQGAPGRLRSAAGVVSERMDMLARLDLAVLRSRVFSVGRMDQRLLAAAARADARRRGRGAGWRRNSLAVGPRPDLQISGARRDRGDDEGFLAVGSRRVRARRHRSVDFALSGSAEAKAGRRRRPRRTRQRPPERGALAEAAQVYYETAVRLARAGDGARARSLAPIIGATTPDLATN